eukprot:4523421-Pleurochrysis_carterae.AAC.1
MAVPYKYYDPRLQSTIFESELVIRLHTKIASSNDGSPYDTKVGPEMRHTGHSAAAPAARYKP